MSLSLKPSHLSRYAAVAKLLYTYGDRDLVDRAGLGASLPDDVPRDVDGDPAALARDLEKLGPTYVKLGQVLASRVDLLPPAVIEALERLQDDVEPFPYAEVEATIRAELGVRLSKAFAEFDPEPLAAASLGQVHRATLRDGRPVAVKVQRPGIRQQILDDLEALDEIAAFVDRHSETAHRLAIGQLLDEFRRALLLELDYRREAGNLVRLAENLRSMRDIVVPQPIDDFTTSRVLTMEFVAGTKITDLSPLARMEIDTRRLAESLSEAYLNQVLVDGFFHADPHPGNVFITPDGRLALLDLGQAARLDPPVRDRLLKLMLSVAEGQGQEAARIARTLGRRLPDFDEDAYTREVTALVAQHAGATLDEIGMGRVVMELAGVSARNGLRPAPELSILGKMLLHLDEITRALDPDFDPNASVRRHAESIMQKRMLRGLAPENVFRTTLETNELLQALPARLNTLLEAVSSQDYTLRIDAFDEVRMLKNLSRMANRLALAIVLAALIVGAALLMQVSTSFTILGYPGIAMVVFMIAAGCGFVLVYQLMRGEDRRPRDGTAG